MRMPFTRGDRRMGQQCEVAHSVVLRGCQKMARLQVGGERSTRRVTTQRHRSRIDTLISAAGFSCFGSRIHCFSNLASDGYTYVMIIGQSSINIHTYPEQGAVSVWIITCPGEDDDGSATRRLERALKEYFGAKSLTSAPLGRILLQCLS